MAPIGILYCIDSLQRGGTELQLAGLLQRLDRTRFQPHLCTLRRSDSSLRPADCPHLELDLPALLRPRAGSAVWRLRSYLRQRDIAIVQTFFQDATLIGAVAAWLARTPARIGCFRDLGFWRNRKEEFRLRCAYPFLTGFLANSEAVKDHICQVDGLSPDRITVIPNGIDPRLFPFVEHTEQQLAVGFVGNLNRRVKRADLFIRAAGRLAPDFPDVTWHVLGDGVLRPECEALAASLQLGDRMVFTGRIAGVSDYLERLAVGVLCSDSEGFSNAVLEYMLRGNAVVATAVGGNREAIQTELTGLLVPAGDDAALAEAIGRFLRDRELRQACAVRARRAAVERYDWSNTLALHEEYYQRALGRSVATASASVPTETTDNGAKGAAL
ncbi:MAG: glycosyltransferase [bacterium]